MTDRLLTIVDDLLSPEECRHFIDLLDGRTEWIDRDIADYHRAIHISSTDAAMILGRLRTVGVVPPDVIGCNDHFRYSHYEPGGRFEMHRDGVNQNSRGHRSRYTVNIFLNDDFEGGSTTFFHEDRSLRAAAMPKAGRAAVFDRQHLHAGEPVVSGHKRILRTDLMVEF